jgi:hypothetical protein
MQDSWTTSSIRLTAVIVAFFLGVWFVFPLFVPPEIIAACLGSLCRNPVTDGSIFIAYLLKAGCVGMILMVFNEIVLRLSYTDDKVKMLKFLFSKTKPIAEIYRITMYEGNLVQQYRIHFLDESHFQLATSFIRRKFLSEFIEYVVKSNSKIQITKVAHPKEL